jgi:hypothetical protein
VTIQSLIEQFTEYKHTVDEDKVQYEEKLAQADKFIRQEKAKNARTNQETIANLKTLMLELEMIEKKNQELHDELQQERVDHERTIAQLAETRDAHDDLEQDVQELKRELKQAKDTAAVNHLLSVRSGGSRIGARPGATLRPGGTLRPARPGANRPDGSSANRFSTLRVDAGFVDLSAEVRALKQQKVELRDQLERESKKLVEVLALVSQLNIVMGINSSSGGSGVVPPTPLTARAAAAAAVAAAESAAKPAPPSLCIRPHRAKSSKVTIRNNLPPPSQQRPQRRRRRRQRRPRRQRQASHLRSAASSIVVVRRRLRRRIRPSCRRCRRPPSWPPSGCARRLSRFPRASRLCRPARSVRAITRTCATIRHTRRNSPA